MIHTTSKAVIFAWVGAFHLLEKLKNKKLDVIFSDDLKKQKPVLGICLGFQLMFSESHEFKKLKD